MSDGDGDNAFRGRDHASPPRDPNGRLDAPQAAEDGEPVKPRMGPAGDRCDSSSALSADERLRACILTRMSKPEQSNAAQPTFSRYRTSPQESLARAIAAETYAYIGTVRRELALPGSVRGLVGQRIRAAIAARSASATPPKTSAA
ncbi:MAG: hypothetical protein KF764_10560 [Labilithrix sp.]|nr:hypothetical protein [Labilithrix sp.]